MNFNNLRNYHIVVFAQLLAIYLAVTELGKIPLIVLLILLTIERMHMHMRAQKVTLAYALDSKQWNEYMRHLQGDSDEQPI